MQISKNPRNHEHAEAYQAEIDRQRAKIKAEMTEIERTNLELIEKVSQELKQANIAFVLFAQPSEVKKGFFQFNWLFTEGAEDFYSEKAIKSYKENMNNFVYGVSSFIGSFGFFIGMLPPPKND